jgi:hypothetical protein
LLDHRLRPAHTANVVNMASKIITVEELEKLTPAERRMIFDASIVTNLDDAPPELLARTRRRVEQLIAESESRPS